MRESVGSDVAGGHSLQAVVADRRRRAQPGIDVAGLELHFPGRRPPLLRCRMAPDARKAVGLQFNPHRDRIRRTRLAFPRVTRPALDTGEALDVMPDFVREDVRAREFSRSPEAILQFLEESEIEVHQSILRTVERTRRGFGKATSRLD